MTPERQCQLSKREASVALGADVSVYRIRLGQQAEMGKVEVDGKARESVWNASHKGTLKSHVLYAYDCLCDRDNLTLVRYCSEVELISDGHHQPFSPNLNPFSVVASVHPSVGAVQSVDVVPWS